MKKYTIIGLIVFIIITGFFTGFYIYKTSQLDNNSNKMQIAELVEDDCTMEAEQYTKKEIISANSKEEKVSPNCTITFKIYYKKCGHIIEKKEEIDKKDVNLTEEEFKNKFPNWEIQRFTSTEITLYKEVNEFCNEHYIIKEQQRDIVIYKLDENNNESFLEKTGIAIEYLEDEDLKKLKDGIIVQSKKELNKVLEDFE